MGGWSPEREVSLNSGAAAAGALSAGGYDVVEIDATIQNRRDLAGRLGEIAPDVVFNALPRTMGRGWMRSRPP